MDYQGRIIPVAYPTRDGEDGEVHIEFYAKDAGFPKVRLAWKTEGDPEEHEKVQELPVDRFRRTCPPGLRSSAGGQGGR